MKHTTLYTAITAGILSLNVFATKASGPGKEVVYETDPATGVKYHFVKHDKKGKKPAMGEVAHVVLTLGTDKDSIFFSSRARGGDSLGAFWIPLNKTFQGCLEQGITLMAAGDSASFKMNSDSVFTKTFHAKAPPFVKPGSMLTFHLKLIEYIPQEVFMKKQQDQMEKQHAMGKAAEGNAITKYLTDNHLNIAPDSNGLYILESTKTNGAAVKEGDSVEMTYKGTLLDGKVFDASANHGGKGTFSFVYSQNASLIRGWIIIVGAMHEGDKVKVLIPSKLAYGERGAGGMIQPNTPLIFEMSLVKVTSRR
ncbi:MAG TPA: FKBP-type peptidyl-prolyl cis-trans isomerase [Bacteroidia bacterium]|jgi:FKBP-type peptidyl-prolyl cis-trans isomerase FkpA|nr:FKBP-type peptidyl-prolyl cis-trans isomerase [Bacteroidia bacterium]